MKKVAAGILSLVLAGVYGSSAVAQTENEAQWNPQGRYTIDFVCTTGCQGTHTHSLNIANYNVDTGEFSGTGHAEWDANTSWNIEGKVSENNKGFDFVIVFTGYNAGYTLEGTGAFREQGTLLGVARSSWDETFRWSSTEGRAQKVKKVERQSGDDLPSGTPRDGSDPALEPTGEQPSFEDGA